MTDDRFKALREALAAGPTPGPWYSGYHGTDVRQGTSPDDYGDIVADSSNLVVARAWRRPLNEPCTEFANAAYIAACSPDRIAALLAEVERLRAERDALKPDAERYRWLRYRVTSAEMPQATGVKLDAAIDAAMEAVQQTQMLPAIEGPKA